MKDTLKWFAVTIILLITSCIIFVSSLLIAVYGLGNLLILWGVRPPEFGILCASFMFLLCIPTIIKVDTLMLRCLPTKFGIEF